MLITCFIFSFQYIFLTEFQTWDLNSVQALQELNN